MVIALQVGYAGAVRGRLPHGWRIAASFDRTAGRVRITSPDTDDFSLNVDTSALHQYGSHRTPLWGVLGDERVEVKFERGVFRCDAAEVPEFWLEVHVSQILPCRKRKSG